MSELVPAAESNGFAATQAKMQALSAAADRLQEGLAQLARGMHRTADLARTTAEMSATAQVDPRMVGQISDVSVALGGTAASAGAVASAAADTATEARGAGEAHNGEYRGDYEATKASGVQKPKPGFLRAR